MIVLQIYEVDVEAYVISSRIRGIYIDFDFGFDSDSEFEYFNSISIDRVCICMNK